MMTTSRSSGPLARASDSPATRLALDAARTFNASLRRRLTVRPSGVDAHYARPLPTEWIFVLRQRNSPRRRASVTSRNARFLSGLDSSHEKTNCRAMADHDTRAVIAWSTLDG